MTSTPPNPEPDPNELVQMNVRIPRELRDALDARRAVVRGGKGLSRDKWVANALRWALSQHVSAPRGQRRTAPRQR